MSDRVIYHTRTEQVLHRSPEGKPLPPISPEDEQAGVVVLDVVVEDPPSFDGDVEKLERRFRAEVAQGRYVVSWEKVEKSEGQKAEIATFRKRQAANKKRRGQMRKGRGTQAARIRRLEMAVALLEAKFDPDAAEEIEPIESEIEELERAE